MPYKAAFGAKMSYILVILMNLLELIALTLTSVMVFYYLRVCVWSSLPPVTELFLRIPSGYLSLKFILLKEWICIRKIYVCGGENVLNA